MLPAFFPANAESFSYAPSPALCRLRARLDSSRCAASSSGVAAVISGAEVLGVQPVRQGEGLGLFDFFFLEWTVCAGTSSGTADSSAADRRIAKARDK